MISLLSLAVCMLLGTVVEILGKPTASSKLQEALQPLRQEQSWSQQSPTI